MADRSGVSIPTIRFYEEAGLLPAPARKTNGHRSYGVGAEKRLRFIRRCRSFGFSLAEIRELATVMGSEDRSCFEARDLAKEHLDRVWKSLLELRALEKDLRTFVSECQNDCGGGAGKDCTILSRLSSHQLGELDEPGLYSLKDRCRGFRPCRALVYDPKAASGCIVTGRRIM
ncbi:MAG: MerR family DNA-binding protein [Acidobacteriota bacterium]|nr:MerR family DNA-binding protein [Acidobacteriota bacterium]